MSNLKDEVLRLFREDEGFRMEVLRMLGIMDVNVALSQLTDLVNKVTKSIEDLREEIRKPWEENHRIWEEVQK
jgi:DnaJ-domain-containing protein 1